MKEEGKDSGKTKSTDTPFAHKSSSKHQQLSTH